MQIQLQRYTQRLIDEQCAKAGKIAICSQNDRICSFGNHDFAELGQQIVQELDCASVIVAEPLHPFPFLLLFRSPPSLAALVPRDSESRSSLHDIPLVRHCQNPTDFLAAICTALRKRKGCIVENIGLISQGSLTVEQSYIAWSSVLHATVIKYFEDLLTTGPQLAGEMETVLQYKDSCLKPFNTNSFLFLPSLPANAQTIISEMSLAGQATVQLGLVDSFFGNISCAAETHSIFQRHLPGLKSCSLRSTRFLLTVHQQQVLPPPVNCLPTVPSSVQPDARRYSMGTHAFRWS
jgi:hypothetical protein